MELNHFAVPHYRINRSSAKISELPEVAAIDPTASFVIAHNGRNYKVSGTTLMTVISNAIIALSSGSETLNPLALPISTATQQALNDKANLVHTHEISHVNGLASYVTDAINLAISGLSFAAVSHTHAIGDVTDLQTVLDSKALADDIPPILESIANLATDKADVTTVTQIQASITNLVTLINNKASQTDLTSLTDVVNDLIATVSGLSTSEHVHAIADITGLVDELAGLASAITALDTRLTAVEENYVVSGVAQW